MLKLKTKKNESDKLTILIYNPISGHGHLDSWNALFTILLLERGYRVLALTPDVQDLQLRINRRGLDEYSSLTLLGWNAKYKLQDRIFLRILKWSDWLNRKAKPDYFKLEASSVLSDMPIGVRFRKRFFRLIVPILYRLFLPVIQIFCDTQSVQGSLSPIDIALHIRAVQNRINCRPDLIINMYLDIYSTSKKEWRLFDMFCPTPWIGLCFAPKAQPEEGYYDLGKLRGIFFLDEEITAKYCKMLPKKHFATLPDVADIQIPEQEPLIVRTIRDRAKGRKIVFFGGCISGYKNISCWGELIKVADQKHWFFVQIGEIHEETLTLEDKNTLRHFRENCPENMFLHESYLSDEGDFNSIIKASDIIFAVYRNFHLSSNMLTKAAYFEKPILVSERFLIGERVRHYNIGCGVREDNVPDMLRALKILAEYPVPTENFAAYRADFSEEKMSDTLGDFISRCLKNPS